MPFKKMVQENKSVGEAEILKRNGKEYPSGVRDQLTKTTCFARKSGCSKRN
jgi:hypothetical protein